MSNTIIVTTTNEISGAKITAYLGVVRGLVVRTPNIGASILGGLKSLLGGNISQFSTVCEAARQHAFDLMVEHAQQAGADAIIGMRYDATEFAQGATEVLAYGTAVKLGQ
ncbi:MAG: YbjQ family protein [Verrucomicrobia bacterium]|nr:YbjQ family protein [Verrucomicrobiota bacterium]